MTDWARYALYNALLNSGAHEIQRDNISTKRVFTALDKLWDHLVEVREVIPRDSEADKNRELYSSFFILEKLDARAPQITLLQAYGVLDQLRDHLRVPRRPP